MKHWVQIFLFIISVHLAWDASLNTFGDVDPFVTGYKLYYGNASRSYSRTIDVGKVLEYVITNIPEEQPIFFSVTAYDYFGSESPYSEELECATIYQSVNGHATITGQMAGWDTPTSQPAFAVESKKSKHVAIVITPETSIYDLTALKLDGSWVEPTTTLTLENVTESHVVYGVIQKRATLKGLEIIK
jgi:hypothetical protein